MTSERRLSNVQRDELINKYPVLYHMAEEGTWPSIQKRGLLSTQALVDLYNPEPAVKNSILGAVRRSSIALDNPVLGRTIIRDQRPLKFLDKCLLPGTSPQQFLDVLNGRVFFWLARHRLETLLSARLYRDKQQTVLHVDTGRLMERYGDEVELAPYNTGSMHIPNAPRRGKDVFVAVDDYPYDDWRVQRGSKGDAVVELTVPYAVPDISDMTLRVESWSGGDVVDVIYSAPD
ncbi:DUF7002 family protein [Catenulispora acidiphila]|nr:hypothetical protein [Catenulispora acidiphila]